MVLDNCEHLLDASAALVVALLAAAEKLTLLATSRDPIGVVGEVGWRVPLLTLADEAVATATGWTVVMRALTTRACVAIAQGEPERAERDVREALASLPEGLSWVGIPDTLE